MSGMITNQSYFILISLKTIRASKLENLGKKKSRLFLLINYVSYQKVLNEIRKLQTATTVQQNDILTKILREHAEVFA